MTLGANAALRLLEAGSLRAEEVGLLLVATETAVDHAKPVGIFLHELLGLPASCRTVELKHAERRPVDARARAGATEGHTLDLSAYLNMALAVDGVLDRRKANPVNAEYL